MSTISIKGMDLQEIRSLQELYQDAFSDTPEQEEEMPEDNPYDDDDSWMEPFYDDDAWMYLDDYDDDLFEDDYDDDLFDDDYDDDLFDDEDDDFSESQFLMDIEFADKDYCSLMQQCSIKGMDQQEIHSLQEEIYQEFNDPFRVDKVRRW